MRVPRSLPSPHKRLANRGARSKKGTSQKRGLPFQFEAASLVAGLVLRTTGGVYDVETADGVVGAVLRGRLRLEERVGDRVVVGDRVEIAPPERPEDPWTIERIADRRSSLV